MGRVVRNVSRDVGNMGKAAGSAAGGAVPVLCCAVLLPGAVGKPRAAARGLLRGSRGEKQKDPFGQRGLLRALAGLG